MTSQWHTFMTSYSCLTEKSQQQYILLIRLLGKRDGETWRRCGWFDQTVCFFSQPNLQTEIKPKSNQLAEKNANPTNRIRLVEFDKSDRVSCKNRMFTT